MSLNNLQADCHHWHVDLDDERILWCYFDRESASVNTLSTAALEELNQIIAYCEADCPTGLVIQSRKKSGFIYGADISEFQTLKTKEDAKALIARGQSLFARIEALACPSVACVHGLCLGGGFELALACHYRIADPGSAAFALPEVKLGILPGWGGSVRLPRLIGALAALPRLLTGKMTSAKTAKKCGMVDALVARRHFIAAARHFVHAKPSRQQPSWWLRLMSHVSYRWLIGLIVRRSLVKRPVLSSQYPAPYRILSNWQRYGLTDQAFVAELDGISSLMLTPTCRALVSVFFLQNKLKSLARPEQAASKRVHVIGAGTMGGDIAAWCALKGYRVSLHDKNSQQIGVAMRRAHALFKKQTRCRLTLRQACDRLYADITGDYIKTADYVIEAIVEDLEIKRSVWEWVAAHAKPDAILATNTSSIPLADIAVVMPDSSRLVGLHFFNPVASMQLVEVVRHHATPEHVLQQSLQFVRTIDRLPIPVSSAPGFLVNRILMPYLLEATMLLDEGVAITAIERAAIEIGFPMGPISLADTVGLDVCLLVAENLIPVYGGSIAQCLQDVVAKGHLGRKSGQGFYLYSAGKQRVAYHSQVQSGSVSQTDIQDRLLCRVLNESIACLREKIVTDADVLDAAIIFGTGFAAFKGGPMSIVRELGEEAIRSRLKVLESTYGFRFKPDAGWHTIYDLIQLKEESTCLS